MLSKKKNLERNDGAIRAALNLYAAATLDGTRHFIITVSYLSY